VPTWDSCESKYHDEVELGRIARVGGALPPSGSTVIVTDRVRGPNLGTLAQAFGPDRPVMAADTLAGCAPLCDVTLGAASIIAHASAGFMMTTRKRTIADRSSGARRFALAGRPRFTLKLLPDLLPN